MAAAVTTRGPLDVVFPLHPLPFPPYAVSAGTHASASHTSLLSAMRCANSPSVSDSGAITAALSRSSCAASPS
jgi:hypothetical protein